MRAEGKKDVRCKRCGGHPMETGTPECRCSISAWEEVPVDVLYVWDEEEA